MHFLLKFGYDGRRFSGYQRGNGTRSVEDTILGVMSEFGICSGFSSAARTDRGVSAAGNVIFFRSDMNIEKIGGILNSKAADVIFHSYSEVVPSFRVRYSSMKHYRYVLYDCGIDADKLRDILIRFKGEHDFSLFSRRDERTPVRVIEDIGVEVEEDHLQINIYGPNFVWNQIRSMVGFAKYYAKTEEHAPDPFSVSKRKWAVAKPEPLILMDIMYRGIDFTPLPMGKKVAIWNDTIKDLRMHSGVLDNIMSVVKGI